MMSTTITLPEIENVRSLAMKYIIEKIGFNIRPDEPVYDKNEKLWKIACNAIVSNFISNKGEKGKNFVYIFHDIGELVYKQTKEGLSLVNYPLRGDIERDISSRFLSLTNEIEKELLICGSDSWGKLSLIKNYLSLLYSMVISLIDEGTLPINAVSSKKNYKFFDCCLNQDISNSIQKKIT